VDALVLVDLPAAQAIEAALVEDQALNARFER
jgi:hypothetical protein